MYGERDIRPGRALYAIRSMEIITVLCPESMDSDQWWEDQSYSLYPGTGVIGGKLWGAWGGS